MVTVFLANGFEEMEALAALFINAGYKNTKIGG